MKLTNIRILVIFFIFYCSTNLFGQQRGYFYADAGMSQTYQGFFYLFDGIVDIGGGYDYHLLNNLYVGPSLHFDFLNRKNTSGRTLLYKPKLNILYEIKVAKRFYITPVASIGYAFFNISNKEFNYKEIQQGIMLGGDLRLTWKTQEQLDFYLFGRYDYIYLDKDDNFTLLEYYRNVNLTSFGIGINIKPKNHEM
ncbi:MAG: hypothetical protein JW731_02360 [Bacteroidales bacterium]|nr:hypothetical protein [Bacteroidales bacterium]